MAIGISGGAVRGGIVFTGDGAMATRIGKIVTALPLLYNTVMHGEAENILADSQDNYVPVETDKLRDSGEIVLIPLSGSKVVQAVVQFGRTMPSRAYALAIHEYPSRFSPPTWKSGVTIQWTKSGTGPQYLAKPLRKARAKMSIRVAAKLKVGIAVIPGAFTTS